MPPRRVAWYFTALTAVTYVLVVFGAVVRTKGAGLSCPDWPLCFGELVPQMDFGVILEWGHRALAGGVSVGLLAGIGILWSAGLLRRLRGFVLASVLILAVQIVLGGLTVLHLLAYWTVTSHLLAGNAFAFSLALLSARLWRDAAPAPREEPVSPALRALAHLVAVVLLAQLSLGGLVSARFAGLACPDWPTCVGGMWFPSFDGLIGLQLMHRLTAYTLAALYLALALSAQGVGTLTTKARIALGLVLVQIGLGVANVLFRLPVEVTAGHSAVAALLVLTTGLLLYDLYGRPSAPQAEVHPVPETA